MADNHRPQAILVGGAYLEQQPQRQDSVLDQLHDLVFVANRLGMYDAADWITERVERR